MNDSHPLAGRETTPLTSEATLAPVPLFQETVAAHTATALRAPRQCRRLDARIDQQQHIIRRPLTKMRPAGRGQPALGCRAASMLVVPKASKTVSPFISRASACGLFKVQTAAATSERVRHSYGGQSTACRVI